MTGAGRGAEGPRVLWRPSEQEIADATLTRFQRHVGVPGGYPELWRWSVEDVERFWGAVWRYFEVDGRFERVLGQRTMPGAEWFPGAELSYPEHIFRGKDDSAVALRFASETRPPGTWSWSEVRARTARLAGGLRAVGVGPGDRVAAYLPNVPETVAAFLATSSLGAIWSSAAPEFGARAVVDRFRQIEPKVLLAVDGYVYGGRAHDRSAVVEEIAAGIPSLERVVRLGYLDGTGWEAGFEAPGPLSFVRVPFEHPLWILYSSGTTGLPKAIVHGHGGILLEQLKKVHLHLDARPDDRVFWFTTTGWMMWNFLTGVLLSDASIVLFDGNPAHPGRTSLWQLAADQRITIFGTSPAFVRGCMKDGIEPRSGRDLSAMRAIGVTGAPLSVDGFRWLREALPGVWPFSTSGGTDVCTAFVGGVPTLPVYEGELQGPSLGCKVESWDEKGRHEIGRVGELVITEPMPSMPVGFWGDPDGARLRSAYFEMYPGVWRHGDWIELTERETAIISGRSDATINRGGVRMGTSEIYRAVLRDPDVVDALVVDLPRGDEPSWMPLFVVLREGVELGPELSDRIRSRVRTEASPRHVPDQVVVAPEIPRTLSGKTLEVPVKRILTGEPAERVASRGSLANPEALDWFVAFAGGGLEG